MMRRRAAGGPGGREEGAHRYRVRERLVSIGDDCRIEDDAGERVFKVDGKALRLRSTPVLQNKEGQDLYRIQERMLRIRDTMDIERADGGGAATISKALITPLRDRWTVRDTCGVEIARGQGDALILAITAAIDQMAHDSGA